MLIKKTRGAQYPLLAEFIFNYNDGMANLPTLTSASVDLNSTANVTDFGSKVQPTGIGSQMIGQLGGPVYSASTNATSAYFEILSLSVGAQVIGGEMQIETAYAGPTSATLAIGDVNSGALYMAATSLIATAASAPTTITNTINGAGNYTTQTMAVASTTGIAIGQSYTVTGCTGAAAPYNGTFVVDSFVTNTSISVTNMNLTSALTYAGTAAATYITGRTAFSIPAEDTNQGGYGYVINTGSEASVGADVRATLTFTGGQAATQGRVRVRIWYTIDGRVNEAAPH